MYAVILVLQQSTDAHPVYHRQFLKCLSLFLQNDRDQQRLVIGRGKPFYIGTINVFSFSPCIRTSWHY